MADIAYARREVSKRPAIPRPAMIRVFRRDCWTCRYCGKRTIFYPVMPLLGVIFREQFPFHTYFKKGQTHPAVVACSSVIDHIVPAVAGGDWLEETNLATACSPCNTGKGYLTLGQLGWKLTDVEESSWDGLSGVYPQLWDIAGRPTAEGHRRWLQALSDATPT
jgi:hypothetical protein